MTNCDFLNIGFIGFGLIGGSIAKAIKAASADKAFSAIRCGSPSSSFLIPIHFPMNEHRKKALSERGGYAQRPLRSFFGKAVILPGKEALLWRVLLSRIKLPVKC